MLETLIRWDTAVFRWCNNHHSTAMDWTMWIITQHWFWGVVLVAVFVLCTLRIEPRRWWIPVIGVVLCFLLADQGSVHLFKNTICRLRPCHALEGVRMFRTHCGGLFGFVSSHAANAFAIVAFLAVRYRKHSKWIGVALLIWALAGSYSRVYLGKHYPGDLLGGAIYGAFCGLLVCSVVGLAEKKLLKIETK